MHYKPSSALAESTLLSFLLVKMFVMVMCFCKWIYAAKLFKLNALIIVYCVLVCHIMTRIQNDPTRYQFLLLSLADAQNLDWNGVICTPASKVTPCRYNRVQMHHILHGNNPLWLLFCYKQKQQVYVKYEIHKTWFRNVPE